MVMRLLLMLSLLVISACVTYPTPFRTSVDAISGPAAQQKTSYILLPGIEELAVSDLQFQEYAGYVHRALMGRGFMRAESFEEASIAVFLSYGIGDPQTIQYSYSLPVWGQTGVTSSTSGRIDVYGNYRSTTTQTPTYGITGSTTATDTLTRYFRFMRLDALDLDRYRESEGVGQVWRTEATSSGSSGDLRRILPILVTAAWPYLGGNTGQKVEIELFEDDPSVQIIKGLIELSPAELAETQRLNGEWNAAHPREP